MQKCREKPSQNLTPASPLYITSTLCNHYQPFILFFHTSINCLTVVILVNYYENNGREKWNEKWNDAQDE